MIAKDENGKIVITSSSDYAECHLERIKAILSLCKERHEDYTDKNTVYHALDLVEDMLPDEIQLKKGIS